ncbi:MAG: ABC transporter ATP-binding protein [Candidatus Firestonebacteria bacterium]|nr:ABC transporter ATP-binding protein [Candidatus Firestonebacteria bacterium]
MNENRDDIKIKISNLHKVFRSKSVLQGVNLDIEKGKTIVIIGRSGCGKSVLLKHLIGILKPDKGSILVDNENISNLEPKDLSLIRKKFGMVFQGAALFDSLTIWENVGFSLIEHSKFPQKKILDIAIEKLKMVGLENVEFLKPSQLSGGMQKRVGIARAIATSPEIILYDEPTTGLDPIMADVINRLIRDLQYKLGVTSIAVTHDMVSAYKIADKISMLYDGTIIEEGTPEKIRNTTNPIVDQFIHGKEHGPITSK